MKQLYVTKCLVISPQDVQAEREAVVATVDRWNGQIGKTIDTLIHAVRSETHSTPELGDEPQSLLNKQIVNDCDFAVAIFWSRLGTPTGRAPSGSIEEINEILAKGGQVMVYHCGRDIPQTLIDSDQMDNLRKALASLRQKGIVFRYTTIEELQLLLMGHLTSVANKLLVPTKSENHPVGKNRDNACPVVVVATWGIPTGMGGNVPTLLCITVQNHSEKSIYVKSIYIELTNGKALAPTIDAFSKSMQGRTELLPGDSLRFDLVFAELLKTASEAGGALRRVVVADQIDRKFYSSEEELQIALFNNEKWTTN